MESQAIEDAINSLLVDVTAIRSSLAGIKSGSVTYDLASLVDGAGATTTITVTGAALGDYALVSHTLDLQGITFTAWVSAVNTVSVRFQNETTSTLDIASGTIRACVLSSTSFAAPAVLTTTAGT
jgi:hypothetical protein